MPMPRIKKNETKEQFIERFMSNLTMRLDFPDEGQRYVIALEQWEKQKKEQK